MKTWLVPLALALSLLAPSFARADSAAARKAIEAGNAKFSEALAKGHAKALTALYTADAYVMPPNLPSVHGSAKVLELWEGFIKQGAKGVVLTTEDVDAAGNLAAEAGSFVFTVQPEGKPEAKLTGKYVVVWKRDKGGWKLHRDIWNANAEAK